MVEESSGADGVDRVGVGWGDWVVVAGDEVAGVADLELCGGGVDGGHDEGTGGEDVRCRPSGLSNSQMRLNTRAGSSTR